MTRDVARQGPAGKDSHRKSLTTLSFYPRRPVRCHRGAARADDLARPWVVAQQTHPDAANGGPFEHDSRTTREQPWSPRPRRP